MSNNGPINVPHVISHAEYEADGSSLFSATATKYPNQYTIMTINISNNTDGPIQLVEAGWDLTGTSLSEFEIEANDQQTLQLPYLRDFSSNGLYHNKRKFAPILQKFSYITEDGLIFTLAIQLTVSITYGILHPNLKPDWSKTITRSGNSNSSYKVTADIKKKNEEAPFSFSVDLIVG